MTAIFDVNMSTQIALLLRDGQFDEAYTLGVRTLADDPANAECWHAIGLLHAVSSRWSEARQALERALSIEPNRASWLRDLGVALIAAGSPKEAEELLRRSFELAPRSGTLTYYGEALEALDRLWDAVEVHRRSIDLDRNAVKSYERLADLYDRLSYYERSCWYAARAARLRRYKAESLQRLGHAQFQVGKLHSALRSYRRSRNRKPQSARHDSSYLFALLHDSTKTASELKHAHEQWFLVHCGTPSRSVEFANNRDPHRKLRIGYLSGEFKSTPTHYFLLPILQAHDRSNFAVFAYHLAPENDDFTDRFQKTADHWRNVHCASSEKIREKIIEDGIDVLVDISGHFVPSGLEAFHKRAAPVQVAYPNYPCTTGCKEIDFFVSDRWTTPNQEFERQYSEKEVYRVPSGYVIYMPPESAPEIGELPASRNGYVTFGLFQRPVKYSESLWNAVSEILRQTPKSRLLIQHASRDLDEPGTWIRNLIAGALGDRGISPERIDFAGTKGVREHLEVVSRADIALDSFHYSGQTTTCASLWMGVPVVSLAGEFHASRVGYALLSRIGLSELAARSLEEYIHIGVSKARDVEGLAALRAGLRERMARSSICRPEIVVREIEDGYRWMWQRWCASKNAGSQQ